jgi:two-component system OmpR family response regulator
MNAQHQSTSGSGRPLGSGPAPRRALFVEDDSILRGLMATFARMLGVRPDEVGTGEDALAYLSTREGAEAAPDVLLLDVDLPGMDGVALCERLATESLFPLNRIVIVSGTVSSEDVERIRSLGVGRILRKPFQLDDLREVLTWAA